MMHPFHRTKKRKNADFLAKRKKKRIDFIINECPHFIFHTPTPRASFTQTNASSL